MEIVAYFFGNFWRWLGATIMLAVVFGGMKAVFGAIAARAIERFAKKAKGV